MKIGYPCINITLGKTTSRTFRLKSYSAEKLKETVEHNLKDLWDILHFNVKNGLLFFRIGSGIVPFASHPVCKFDWQSHFEKDFIRIGAYIKNNRIRISMHPDQFTLINAIDKNIVTRSISELAYHVEVLDLMELNQDQKVQIHVGGVYNDKAKSIQRFVKAYRKLPLKIKRRLAIENDDRSYNLKDCLFINRQVGIPVIFDTFHHKIYNNGESYRDALISAAGTWKKRDGLPMIDHSNQAVGKRTGSHAESIDPKIFTDFLEETRDLDFDIMLEIKDKESSAMDARKYIRNRRTSINRL